MIEIVAPSESFSMLAHFALEKLWAGSDFSVSEVEADMWGCCHQCCAPCHALYSLDQEHHLDYVMSVWKEAPDKFQFERMPGGLLHVRRGWMYTQWLSSGIQRANECGHSVYELLVRDRPLRADVLEYVRDPHGYLGFPKDTSDWSPPALPRSQVATAMLLDTANVGE